MSSSSTPIVQPDDTTPAPATVPVAAAVTPVAPDPVSASDPAPAPTADIADGDGEVWVQVNPGDSWESLADAANLSVEELQALNADQPYFSERSVQVGGLVRIA